MLLESNRTESHDTQTYFQQKVMLVVQCYSKMKAFVNFLVEERDNLAKDSVDEAIKKCTELEIPIQNRKICRKRKCQANMQKLLALVFESNPV